MPDGTVIDSFSIVKSGVTAVQVASFTAAAEVGGIRLRWQSLGSGGEMFRIYRGPSAAAATERVGEEPITGGTDHTFLDTRVEPGVTYGYRIAVLDAAGHESWVASASATAAGAPRLVLRPARPNPFDRETRMAFTLPRAGAVRLTVTDVHGRSVRTLLAGALEAGEHQIPWDGRDDRGKKAATGIYFATLDHSGVVLRTRIALLR